MKGEFLMVDKPIGFVPAEPAPPAAKAALGRSPAVLPTTGYREPEIPAECCPQCKNLLLELSAAIRDFNGYAQPKLAKYSELSFGEVKELNGGLKGRGERVKAARRAYEKHLSFGCG